MSITGESFDYGPYAFIPTYDPQFTAAYFDHFGRYSYGNQPGICRWNLEMLQRPLAAVIPAAEMEAGLSAFPEHYFNAYTQCMVQKLGFAQLPAETAATLITETLKFLLKTQIGYHSFFIALREQFVPQWREDAGLILANLTVMESADQAAALDAWRGIYFRTLLDLPDSELPAIAQRLRQCNPATVLLRPAIEAVWEPIAEEDNWQPFYELLQRLQAD